jgi:methyl-CpG-binding domain protein 4
MWKFFEKYPDPVSASSADPSEIREMIKPLGLSERRSRTLIRMSDDYINKDWKYSPDVLYGIGKYGSDAYRIFCLGEWRSVMPSDHALNDYHEFLKRVFY